MRIEVGGTLDQDFLPLPYPASRVDIEGAWLYDASSLNVFGEGETVRNKSYGVDYLDVAPTAEQLRAAPEPPDAIRSTYTRLPRSLPTVVRTTAADLTADLVVAELGLDRLVDLLEREAAAETPPEERPATRRLRTPFGAFSGSLLPAKVKITPVEEVFSK